MGKDNEAGEYFKKVLEFDPRHINALNNLGVMYAKEGKFNEAVALINQSLSIDPNYPNAYVNRSVILKKQGQRKQALEDALKAQSLGYENLEGYIRELRSHFSKK